MENLRETFELLVRATPRESTASDIPPDLNCVTKVCTFLRNPWGVRRQLFPPLGMLLVQQ